MLKVAIDNGALEEGHRVRGIGFYSRNLVEGLSLLKSQVRVDVFSFFSEPSRVNRYDIAHYPYYDLFFNTLLTPFKIPTVVTIHDVIPLIYPKQYPKGIKGSIAFYKQKKALKAVSAIITDTQTSKKDIVRFLDVEEKKINVIYLAASRSYKIIKDRKILESVIKKYGLPQKFILYVGDINYNKNLINLIRAIRKVGLKLVIVGKSALDISENNNLNDIRGPRDYLRYYLGKVHPEITHFKKLAKEFEKAGVLRLGFISNEDLAAIYNLATFYVQPSYYEGFGLPPLEAMASGCPVLISKTQALVEVCGDASITFDQKQGSRDLANKLSEIVKDKKLQRELSERGIRHAARYSWEKAALETLEVYKKLVKPK